VLLGGESPWLQEKLPAVMRLEQVQVLLVAMLGLALTQLLALPWGQLQILRASGQLSSSLPNPGWIFLVCQ
jgi:hypothetical protein